jgi:hypothetical protein
MYIRYNPNASIQKKGLVCATIAIAFCMRIEQTIGILKINKAIQTSKEGLF